MYERIKRWYMLGLWSEKMVRQSVAKGVLTDEECNTIIEEGEE